MGSTLDHEEKPEVPDDSFAARAKQAREMLKVSRGAVGRAAKLSIGHYNRLELNQKQPDVTTCKRVVAGFKELGLRVTVAWLTFGEGTGPRRIRKKKKEAGGAVAKDALS